MLNRRDTLRGMVMVLGATAAGMGTQAAAQTATAAPAALSWTPKALTADHARLVDVVAELVIPATDTPGAREAGVPQFVDRALATYYDKPQADALVAGLNRIDTDSRALYGGKVFVALTPQQQVDLLTRYDAEALAARQATPSQPHFFPVLEDLITIGYFTSEPGGTKALAYDPVPGGYRGDIPLAEIGKGWAL